MRLKIKWVNKGEVIAHPVKPEGYSPIAAEEDGFSFHILPSEDNSYSSRTFFIPKAAFALAEKNPSRFFILDESSKIERRQLISACESNSVEGHFCRLYVTRNVCDFFEIRKSEKDESKNLLPQCEYCKETDCECINEKAW